MSVEYARVAVADAGGNHTVTLPENSLVLDGNVRDDGSIVHYAWTQLGGPNAVQWLNADKAKSTVSDLEQGTYHFRFNVTDDGGLSAYADTFVFVVRSE